MSVFLDGSRRSVAGAWRMPAFEQSRKRSIDVISHVKSVACDALSLRQDRPFTIPDVPDEGLDSVRSHA